MPTTPSANRSPRRQAPELLADDANLARSLEHASLWRLYRVAVNEIRTRREQGADTSSISAATIEAIRASMDAAHRKTRCWAPLGSLSNAIAGGPYIGLLGTVLGIMVVFLGTAMAGDVNINAIAPGMAAALLATAMGLFVAIPPCLATTAWSRATRKSAPICACSSTSSSRAWPKCMARRRSRKPPTIPRRALPAALGPRRAARRRRSIRRSHGFRIRRPG